MRTMQSKRWSLDAQGLQWWRVSKNLHNPIWSQAYAAKWMGVTLRTYARWERGTFAIPRYAALRIFEYEQLTGELLKLTGQPFHTPNLPL